MMGGLLMTVALGIHMALSVQVGCHSVWNRPRPQGSVQEGVASLQAPDPSVEAKG